jgi:hypothetical protein
MPSERDTQPFPLRWLADRGAARPDSGAVQEIRAAITGLVLDESQLLRHLKERAATAPSGATP